jgi:hypothetical protein
MRLARIFLVLTLSFTAGLAFSQSQSENEQGVSAEQDLSRAVHIFPNPAVEYVHIKLTELTSANVKLAVHNILGNKMETETEVVDEHELRVRVKDLPSGYYLLAIKDEEAKFRGTFKFLKR